MLVEGMVAYFDLLLNLIGIKKSIQVSNCVFFVVFHALRTAKFNLRIAC